MSSLNKDFWMSNGSNSLPIQEKDHDTSARTSEQKRGHEWLMNASEQELLSQKKQVTTNTLLGAKDFRPNHVWRLSGSDDQVPINPYSINNAKEMSSGFQYLLGETSSINRRSYLSNNTTYGRALAPGFGAVDKTFLSIGQPSSNDTPTMLQPYDTTLSLGPMPRLVYHSSNCSGSNHFLAWNYFDGRVNNGEPNIALKTQDTRLSLRTEQSSDFLTLGGTYNNKGKEIAYQDNNHTVHQTHPPSSWHAFLTQQQIAPASRGKCAPNDAFKQLALQDVCRQLSTNTLSEGTQADLTKKDKEPDGNKRVAPNKFPTNVKSLLATRVLDGVPVKYISWSREHTLRGVISGSGYVCSCKDCNFSKIVNAYDFEKHAGGKTKHPNNNIYFSNGKTIYTVVQELRNTSDDQLFDVMEKVTGTPLNHKNFLKWKETYQARRIVLQRLQANDDNAAMANTS